MRRSEDDEIKNAVGNNFDFVERGSLANYFEEHGNKYPLGVGLGDTKSTNNTLKQ